MNLEEMQQAWKELNERVARNEILHREEVKRILNTRRESCLERLTRVGKTGLAVTATVCLVYVAAWMARPGFHILPAITGAILNQKGNQSGDSNPAHPALQEPVQLYPAGKLPDYRTFRPLLCLLLRHALQHHRHITAAGRLRHSRLLPFPPHARPGETDG